jgi:hypothetical protein
MCGLAATCALAACTAVDRHDVANLSRITPTPEGFLFHAQANTSHPENSAHYEAVRVDVMKRFAEANGYCPRGYTAGRRNLIRRPPTPIGIDTLRDITYYARCN